MSEQVKTNESENNAVDMAMNAVSSVTTKVLNAKNNEDQNDGPMTEAEINRGMQKFYKRIERQMDDREFITGSAYEGEDAYKNFTKLSDNLRFYDICKQNGLLDKYPPKDIEPDYAPFMDGPIGDAIVEKNTITSDDRLRKLDKFFELQAGHAGLALRNDNFGYELGATARSTEREDMTVLIINNGPTNPQYKTTTFAESLGYNLMNMYLNKNKTGQYENSVSNTMDFSRGADDKLTYTAEAEPVIDKNKSSSTPRINSAHDAKLYMESQKQAQLEMSPADKIAAMKNTINSENELNAKEVIEKVAKNITGSRDNDGVSNAVSGSAKEAMEQAKDAAENATKNSINTFTGNRQRGDEFTVQEAQGLEAHQAAPDLNGGWG